MAATIRQTKRFRAEVKEVAKHLAVAGSSAVAKQFAESVGETLRCISEHPRIGRIFDERTAGFSDIRVVAVANQFRNWLLFYRVEDGEVLAISVLHGARDIESALADE